MTVVLDEANKLLSCFVTALSGYPDPPTRAELRVGDQVIHDVDGQTGTDMVCCPGLAYVRFGSGFPSSNFPTPDTDASKCAPTGWAVEYSLGIVRCIPGMASTAGPDATDWLTAFTHDTNDFEAMREALCCWSASLTRGRLWFAGVSVPTMQANCVERAMPVFMSVGRCC